MSKLYKLLKNQTCRSPGPNQPQSVPITTTVVACPMQLQFVIYHNYGNNSVYLVIIHSDLKQVYETHRDIYEGIKKPPPNAIYFKKPPPNTTPVLSPLNNDKKLQKASL